jgi:hydroxyacylglutathione hydrolase
MFFRMIYDPSLAQAAYLIGCQRTQDAIIIDPERDIDRYLEAAAAEKLRITAVAETHIHADFLSGSREFAERTGAKLYVSDEGDADWKYQWLGKKADGRSFPHQLLHHNDTFKVGNIQFKVIHTPGHTPEHISFAVTDLGGGANEPMGLITGDFVFVGDLGRPDLLETAAGIAGVKEASAHTLFKSAREFLKLPEYLQVWPAHGAGSACGKALGAVPQSTVGYEKRFNLSLRAADDEQIFVHNILEGQPEPPLYFARMKRLNRDGAPLLKDGRLPAPRELNVAELRKADAKAQAILDTRPWSYFRAGHIPGALHTPLGNQFATLAGAFVEKDEPINVLCEAAEVDEAVRCLVRVGLDNVIGFATPATLDAATRAGLKLNQTREIDATAFMREMNSPDALVLDVRRAAEYDAGHVPGSLNFAHTRLLKHIGDIPGLPGAQPLLVHCQGGTRSAYASALLERHGFTPTNIAGGFGAYERAGGEVVRETVHA